MNAIFRVDAAPATGFGHVVRCHALAQALGERGVESRFLTAEDASFAWLQKRRARVARLADEPGSSADAEAVGDEVRRSGAEWLVTDGDAFRTDYLERLASCGPALVAIDDLAAWRFPCDVLVNGGLGAQELTYDVSSHTRLLLGARYLLLRPEFRRAPRHQPRDARRVLVCFGGSDPDDRTRDVVEAWLTWPEAPALEIVVGAAYTRFDALQELAPDARVHRDIDAGRLAALMTESDLAVVSAGMVACELAALGVPMAVVVLSEDQRRNAGALVRAGAAGLVDPFTPSRLIEVARALLADAAALAGMGRAASSVVDGRGAERVAGTLVGERRGVRS